MDLTALHERRRRKAIVAVSILQAESGGNASGIRQGDPISFMPWLMAGATTNFGATAGALPKVPSGERQIVAGSLKASVLSARDIWSWRQQRRCLAARGQSTALASSHRNSNPKPHKAADPSHTPTDLTRVARSGEGAPPSPSATQRSTFNDSSSNTVQRPHHTSAAELLAICSKLHAEVSDTPPLLAPPAAHCQLRDIAQAIRDSSLSVYTQLQQENAARFLRMRNERAVLGLTRSYRSNNSICFGDLVQEYHTNELSVAHWEECKAVYKDLTVRDRTKLTLRDTVCTYLVPEHEVRRHTSSLKTLPEAWQQLVRFGKSKAVAAAVAGVKALRLTVKEETPKTFMTLLNAGRDPHRLPVSHLEPLACAGVYAVTQILMETCPKDGTVNPHELYDILSYIQPPTPQQCVHGKGLSRKPVLPKFTAVLHHSLEHLFHVASRYKFSRGRAYMPAQIVRHDIISSAHLNAMAALGPYGNPIPNCAFVREIHQLPLPSPPVSPPRASTSSTSAPRVLAPCTSARPAAAADDPLNLERHAVRGAKLLASFSAARKPLTGGTSSGGSSISTKSSSSSGGGSGSESNGINNGILRRVSRDLQSRDSRGVSSNNSSSSSSTNIDIDYDSDVSTSTTVRLDKPRVYGVLTAASPSPSPSLSLSSSPSPLPCHLGIEDCHSWGDIEFGPVVGGCSGVADGGGGSGGVWQERLITHKMKKLAAAVAEETRREVWWLSVLDVVDPDLSQALVSDLVLREPVVDAVRHDQRQQQQPAAATPPALMTKQSGLAYRLMMLAKRAANSVLIAPYDDVLGSDEGTALLPCQLLHGLEEEDQSSGTGNEHVTSGLRPAATLTPPPPTAESEMVLLEGEVRSLGLRERNRIKQLSTVFHAALASDVRLAKLVRLVLTWHRRAVISGGSGAGGGRGRGDDGTSFLTECKDVGDVDSDVSDVTDDSERQPAAAATAAAAAAASTLPIKKILDALAWLRPGLLESVHPESWGQLAEEARGHEEHLNPRYGMAEKALRLGLLGLILLAHRPDLPLRQLRLLPCVAAGATYKAWATRLDHPPSVKQGSLTLPDPVTHYQALAAFAAFGFLPGRLHAGRERAAAATAARNGTAYTAHVSTSSPSQAEMAAEAAEVEGVIDKASAAKVFGRGFAQAPAVWTAIGLYVSVQVLADEEGLEQPWLLASAPTAAADDAIAGGGAGTSDVKANGVEAHGLVAAVKASHRPQHGHGRGVDSLLQDLKRDLVVVAARDSLEGTWSASASGHDSGSGSGAMRQPVVSPPLPVGRFDVDSCSDELLDISSTIRRPRGAACGGSAKTCCSHVAAASSSTECADPWSICASAGGGTGPNWLRGRSLAEAFRPGSDSDDECWFPTPDVKEGEKEQEEVKDRGSEKEKDGEKEREKEKEEECEKEKEKDRVAKAEALSSSCSSRPLSASAAAAPGVIKPLPLSQSGGWGSFWKHGGGGGGGSSNSGCVGRHHGSWAMDDTDKVDKGFDDFLTAMITNEMQPEAQALLSEEELFKQILGDISPHLRGGIDPGKDSETSHSAARTAITRATSTSTAAASPALGSTVSPIVTSTATDTASGTLQDSSGVMPPPATVAASSIVGREEQEERAKEKRLEETLHELLAVTLILKAFDHNLKLDGVLQKQLQEQLESQEQLWPLQKEELGLQGQQQHHHYRDYQNQDRSQNLDDEVGRRQLQQPHQPLDAILPPPQPSASRWPPSLPPPPPLSLSSASSMSLCPNGGSAAHCWTPPYAVLRKSSGVGAAGATSGNRRKQLGGPNSNPRQSLAQMMRVWRCAAGRSGGEGGGGGGGRRGGGGGGSRSGSGGEMAPSTSSSNTEYITAVGGPGMALALTALCCGDQVRSSGRGSGTKFGSGSIFQSSGGSNFSEQATSPLRSSVLAATSVARAAVEASRSGGFLHSCFQPIASAKSAQMALGGQLGQRAAEQDVFPPPEGVPGVALLSVRRAAVSEELLDTLAVAAVAWPDGRPAGNGGSCKGRVAGMRPGSELLLVSERHSFKTAAAMARKSLVSGRSGSLRVHAMGVDGLETAIMLLAQIRVEMMKQKRDLVVVVRKLDNQGIAGAAVASDDVDESPAASAAAEAPPQPATGASDGNASENLSGRGKTHAGGSGGSGDSTAAACVGACDHGDGGKTAVDPVVTLLREYDGCIAALKNFLPALNLGLQGRRTQPDIDLEQQLDELASEGDAAAAARQRSNASETHDNVLASAGPSGYSSEFQSRFGSGLGSRFPDPKDGLLARKLCDSIRTLESLMVGHSAVRKGLVADLLVCECELNKPDCLVVQ
ncbi:hypothetical protein VaNZ11_016287 [Volvox africanus]|uniref:Uncharacterized protein n=1 Tax=Volvox africanus TaxID=51714 RepID=A0ABQ5SNL7_9CHLO|nr:hypothetical protein VaNZ11_016287 [Volvox africanus]